VIQGGRVQYNWRRQPLLAYDANGFKTVYTYDTLGQITQKTTFADTPKAQTTTYVYRHWGSDGSNDVVVTVPGERAVLHKFNAHGNEVRTEISVPPGLAVPSGWQTVQSTKYDARQLPIEIKGRDFYCLLAAESGAWRESTTLNNYDTYRRITRIEQPDGVYDEFIYNRATFKQERRRLGSTTPAERWEYTADGKIYFYDQLSTDGSGAAVSSSAAFAYDGHGRLIRTLDPLPIGSPGPFAISKYAYDYHDRLVSEQHYTSPAWDAQPTDPCKRITYTYDPMLRAWNMGLITKLTADSNKPGTEFMVATRSYDTAGRCLTEDDGAGRTSTYSYPNDGEQRPSKMVDASGAGYEQTFDSITGAITQLSLLTTGRRYAFTWDSVNRLIGAKLQDAQGAVLNAVTFAYDDFGRRNEERTAGADYSLKTLTVGGRLASASGGGDVHCFYDDCGRLTRKVYEKPNPSVPLKMEINIAYSQSSGGTMSRMTLSDTEAGMVASIDFAHVDGRETSRTYTIANQERLKIQSYYADPTTKLRQRNYVIAPLSATLEERYAFDALNRLSGIDYKKTVGTTVSQASATFGFDEHARIQTVSGSNLAGPVNASYTYQARSATGGPDMLTSVTQSGSTQSIGYQRGSMSNASGIAAMQYSDTQNLLSAANTNAADPDDLKIQCTYDALNRFAKSVVTQTRPHALSHEVNYVFADGTITGEFAQPVPGDASKSERTRFLRANGVLLGRIVMRPNPPTTVASFAEIFATDSKGSVMGVFAYQGATVMKSTYYTYDAYGQRTEFNA
jgi:YD repeat-containing protein